MTMKTSKKKLLRFCEPLMPAKEPDYLIIPTNGGNLGAGPMFELM